ncbi:DUF1826 domain-containing protein [Mangrovicoccus sp. HB161399]|uniref:DUF1826 domain-containing protein n=1 Tax=Mangrovicoccus sp. HB161399 TaxID=2720392 RepID=UPI001553DF7D|nr:DUF1826 domain-containing protein [Mangrovicoccus sp. HB161399]
MSLDLPRLAEGIESGPHPSVLRRIGRDGTALAIWQRRMPADLRGWLDGLPAGRMPQFRRTLPAGTLRLAVAEACRRAGTPGGAGQELLAAEICLLGQLAADVFGCAALRVRLEVATRQTCPKWHVDAVPVRMVCTLRGPGTEWGPIGPDGVPRRTHRLETGEVGLFRGALWPGDELAAILHRSPQATPERPRLALAIDPAPRGDGP